MASHDFSPFRTISRKKRRKDHAENSNALLALPV
jgi:hypothetical protein